MEWPTLQRRSSSEVVSALLGRWLRMDDICTLRGLEADEIVDIGPPGKVLELLRYFLDSVRMVA